MAQLCNHCDRSESLSSLAGLDWFDAPNPSHKWLGYFQRSVEHGPVFDNSPAIYGWEAHPADIQVSPGTKELQIQYFNRIL
jgi:hypothetical protein